MDEIKVLIYVIQGFAGVGALIRIVFHILNHINEEDKSMRNKKIKNVLKSLLYIETGLALATIIVSYYGG